MKKKVYLAGPMRCAADRNKPIFDRAAAALRAMGYFVFNPADTLGLVGEQEIDDTTVEGARQVFAVDTEWICRQADIVVMLPGWAMSRGAEAEYHLARAIGLEVMFSHGDIELSDE